MKKWLVLFFPSKSGWRMLRLVLPAVLFGWIFLPTGTTTYVSFITLYILIMIWSDVMEIRDKLGIK